MQHRTLADLAQPIRAASRAAGWKMLSGVAAATLVSLFAALPAQAAKAPPGVFPAGPAGRAPIVPLQFDVIGFIQEAKLDTGSVICRASDPKLRGGTLKVNGREIVVPCNTVL